MHDARLTTHAAALLACVFASAAAAQSDEVLQRLGSPEYAEREAATRELLADPQANLVRLRALFERAETAEQRHRLLDAIRHHTLRQMREEAYKEPGGLAAIGFSHEVLPAGAAPGVARPSIYVVATLPGFPGYAHLRPGDIITSVGDEPMPMDLDADRFKELMRGFEAGQTLTLGVLRDGETLSVTLKLASFEALDRMYGDVAIVQPPFGSQWRRVRDALLAAAPAVPELRVPPRAAGEAPD